MFWEETKGLRTLPMGYRVGISAFLILAGIGYLLGFANIYLTYSPIDQKPGLSVKDIRLSFYGAREGTRLEKSIAGGMKQYLASDADRQKIVDWAKGGGKESGFPAIKPILDSSCSACHSKIAKTAGVATEDYADVSALLAQDTGKPLARLVALSHTHLLATLPLIFLLGFVFSFTQFPQRLKGAIIVFSFASILIDIGSWWLAKLAGQFAFLVILGGVCLALSFAALILPALYDLWLRTTAK
jgi:hypothetical protein